eukprot:4424599-Amphidinium_carterae.2
MELNSWQRGFARERKRERATEILSYTHRIRDRMPYTLNLNFVSCKTLQLCGTAPPIFRLTTKKGVARSKKDEDNLKQHFGFLWFAGFADGRLPTKPVATLSVERAARPMDRAAPVPPPLGRAQTNPHQV